MTVRNVVFDIGGVLLDWDPRQLYRRLVPDEDQLEWFLANVCTLGWNLTLDAGRSFDEACDELAAAHPEHAELVHAWKRQAEMVAGEVPGTGELVRRLRERGVPLYLLTNMPADVFDERVATYELLQGFDGAVVSGRERVVKPSPAIFHLVIGRYGLQATETLFIDDSQPNVEAAEAVGMAVHHFRDAARLESALRELGLLG